MSLLLEALKKAEKAKEEAQRRARGESAPSTELRLEGDDPAKPAAKHIITRDELPDISEPLEIRSDDIAPAAAAAPLEARADATVPPLPARPRSSPGAGETQAGARAAAKKVFEAKFKEPNPRLPFYVTIGILGAFALGTVGYFWYQLRPMPTLVNANPPPSGGPLATLAASKPPLAPPVAQPPAAATIVGLPAAVASASSAPSLPGSAAPAASPTPAARGAPVPAAITPVEATSRAPSPPSRSVAVEKRAGPSVPAARAAARTPADSAGVNVSQPAAAQVHPKVDSAYTAYLAGDWVMARNDYQQALREEPSNRDALLGLAALDVRSGRIEAAEATYLRLLQADPRDAHAQAGLVALRGARMDPMVTESRIKSLLATDPGADVLHFALGNQLAQQGRWAEAQQQYFQAFSAEPDNADFAYNLAVSLDQLRQPKLALEYYRRALALAEKRGASFDAEAAKSRAAQLQR